MMAVIAFFPWQVLVDSSVWVHHFRDGLPQLDALLQQNRVCIHPMVTGEIACGTPPGRKRLLADLAVLPPVQHASDPQVLDLIDRENLYGQGCGWVDMHLLTATRLTPHTRLWTLDKRLAALALRLGVVHPPHEPS